MRKLSPIHRSLRTITPTVFALLTQSPVAHRLVLRREPSRSRILLRPRELVVVTVTDPAARRTG
jgi:hypothetical protein